MGSGPHVLIADDHDLFRRGLRHALQDGIEGVRVCEAGTFDEAQEALASHADFALASFDLRMPGMQAGLGVVSIRRLYPKLPVAVLSAFDDRRNILAALEWGVSGFIPKGLPADAIVSAMLEIMSGKIYIPSSITSMDAAISVEDRIDIVPRAPPASSAAVDPGTLTPRQEDVLARLVAGRSTKEIARDLDLAEGTVKIHLAALFRMLGARSRTEAVAKAITLGLTSARSGRK